MNMIYTTCSIHYNSIDVYTYAGYFLRIDCTPFLHKEILFAAVCSCHAIESSGGCPPALSMLPPRYSSPLLVDSNSSWR